MPTTTTTTTTTKTTTTTTTTPKPETGPNNSDAVCPAVLCNFEEGCRNTSHNPTRTTFVNVCQLIFRFIV